MALELARALAATERDANLHIARILLLMNACAGRSSKPLDGITKLAKLDFMLRYPNCLERALQAEGKATTAAEIQDYERSTIESKMIRFRYGPWDHRYRRWIALMVAKDLVAARIEGRTVKLALTELGRKVAAELAVTGANEQLAARAKVVASTFGGKSGTALKEFVYSTFPEIIDMKWGQEIAI